MRYEATFRDNVRYGRAVHAVLFMVILGFFCGRFALRRSRQNSTPRNPEVLDHLAWARFGEQRYEEALALYRTLAELDPDNALTHANLGAALYQLGRAEEALQSIERALALDPDLEFTHAGMAEVHQRLRQRGQ